MQRSSRTSRTSGRSRSWLAAAVALLSVLAITQTACFGRFALTRDIYKWNSNVHPSKWVRWVVFLGCSLVPVYGGALLIDVVFANSVEFWTGKNPLAAVPGATRFVRGPGGELAALTLRGDGAIDVRIEAEGQPERRFVLVRAPDSVSAFDEHGALIARVGDGPDGEPALLAAR